MRVRREVILLDLGIIAVRDSWDADQSIALESVFTLHPDIQFDAAHNLLRCADDEDWQCHVVAFELGNTNHSLPKSPLILFQRTTGRKPAPHNFATLKKAPGNPCSTSGHRPVP